MSKYKEYIEKLDFHYYSAKEVYDKHIEELENDIINLNNSVKALKKEKYSLLGRLKKMDEEYSSNKENLKELKKDKLYLENKDNASQFTNEKLKSENKKLLDAIEKTKKHNSNSITKLENKIRDLKRERNRLQDKISSNDVFSLKSDV